MILIFAVALTCLTLTVIITDTSRFIIPNRLVLALLALYPVLLFIAPAAREDWQAALLIALGTLVVGFPLFLFRLMGGGDVKLLVALALFTGKKAFPPFIMGVAIFGGVLAVTLLLIRPTVAFAFSKLKNPPLIPRVLTIGEPVPYGVAIAIAFLIALWSGSLPGLPL